MYLLPEKIENISESFLYTYYLLPGMPHRPVFRIDPVILAEKVLNARVSYGCLSPDGSVLGATAFEDINVIYRNYEGDEIYRLEINKNEIIVDESLIASDDLKGRHNFTVAHEAGHLILKQLYGKDYCPDTGKPHFYRKVDMAYSTPATKAEEWQANALASALLMPKKLVSTFFEGLGITKPIRLYRNGQILKREKKILNAFCELFEVSRTSALIRLSHLGYTQRRTDEEFCEDYDYDILSGGRILL